MKLSQFSQRSNSTDEVEYYRNRAPYAETEMAVLTKVEPNGRRLVRHLSACSASPCASDQLTRRREGAEICTFYRSRADRLPAILAHPWVILQHVRAGRPRTQALGMRARRPRSQEARGSIMLPSAIIRYSLLPSG